MTYLNKLTPGQTARVVGYSEDNPVTRRLTELGLIPGRQVKYLRDAPLKDPLQLQVGTSSLGVRHSEASLITVELES
ncbi:MAG: ferrous iron transport protein A [bacterium]|nr:ferrous iron transport protein A [bacterium]